VIEAASASVEGLLERQLMLLSVNVVVVLIAGLLGNS
jgi:hypothetical protein